MLWLNLRPIANKCSGEEDSKPHTLCESKKTKWCKQDDTNRPHRIMDFCRGYLSTTYGKLWITVLDQVSSPCLIMFFYVVNSVSVVVQWCRSVVCS